MIAKIPDLTKSKPFRGLNYDLSPHQWTFDFSSGKIKLRANPKFVVNVVDSDLGDDSTINLWEDNDSDTQKWDFKRTGSSTRRRIPSGQTG